MFASRLEHLVVKSYIVNSMYIVAVIYCQHGREVLSGLRKLEKIVTKLGAWQNHRHFNIRCIHNNLTPISIRLSSNVKGIMAEKTLKKTVKKLLDIRIRQCTYMIKKLSDQKDILENDLYGKIPPAEKNLVEDFISHAYRKLFDMSKTRQRDKFSRLQEKIA